MDLKVLDTPARVYTGGRSFDRELPTVVLIHGAGHDHSVWNHQARHLAHHGFGVLAPDLPGHGASAGPQRASIPALGDWIAAVLDAAGVVRAALVGHSMGSLIALEATARHPDRVSALVLVGSAAPMPVAQPLLDAAAGDRAQAHAMINQWSYTPASHLGASPSPGLWLPGVNARLMAQQDEGVLSADLLACNAYTHGLEAAAAVRAPTLLIRGGRDQMTPARAGKPLHDALVNAAGGARMISLSGAGHALMAEAPDAVTDAIRGFLTNDR
ncbi:alpha/beta fold hydrolase [Pseudothauera rhizosphaerae]|uniref:Alpha/beta fold hydrolase n=1 Tax=Pseudothauera rhizosphaerae TaxID=2565932 RepID=A0A4S4ATS4_9RHOO|nr:alpha/beta hydrolase [Pseudothauera rhizosphaerae]THF62599.1 alpha/beta fold hydrolase [Pseudothauera rhizosphaerae]